ncbi:MAG: Zn-dependent hydrolase [Promethearchaeota archaeon CR_4]|nr:MAG: Zn-dependent hydrolase [Candidatus Lokiarchaeota archaeon CR_4]
MKPIHVHAGVYQVGGDGLSGGSDCLCYAVDCGQGEIALIDCGVRSKNRILENIQEAGMDYKKIGHIFITHIHIDHTGAAHSFQEEFPKAIFYAHEQEVPALEGDPGTSKLTAASWYGVEYLPIRIQHKIKGKEEVITIGNLKFHCVHIPGHTTGSMALYCDVDGKRVLFGQDVHGPIMPEFGSNPHDYEESLHKMMTFDADILCEGHYGIMVGKTRVKDFIESFLH